MELSEIYLEVMSTEKVVEQRKERKKKGEKEEESKYEISGKHRKVFKGDELLGE